MSTEENYMVSVYICSQEEIIFISASSNEKGDFLSNEKYKLIAYFKNGFEGELWHAVAISETITLLGGVSMVEQDRLILVNAQSKVLRTRTSNKWYGDWERPIPPPIGDKFIYPIASKGLLNGHLYIISHNRGVFRRDGINQWTQLVKGFPVIQELEKQVAFRAIDGFSDDNLYVGGDAGDLWCWDGSLWNYIDLMLNSTITNILCAEDGFVYIAFQHETRILKGRNEKWEFISAPDKISSSYETYKSMVWFKDRVYVNAGRSYDLYEIKNDTLIPSDLNNHKDAPSSWGKFMDARDGIMVIGDETGTVLYDGTNIETLI